MSDSLSPSSPSPFETQPACAVGPAAVTESASERRSKHEMIEAIRQRNPSARAEFLSDFDEPTLASYLRRLTLLSDRRGRESVWVRDSASRAVVTRMRH